MKLIPGLVALPGTSRANKTGSWRIERPLFLHQKCNGCRLCDWCCPEGIVSGQGKLFDCDFDYCKGCGICAEVCPVDDIVMQVEER
ncbi:MAG: 4Fe-4S binding protein [Chloroflexi bacterium]|nr:4Fe-4S binding protein [Chloroflexota bacterium]